MRVADHGAMHAPDPNDMCEICGDHVWANLRQEGLVGEAAPRLHALPR
jgi:hypothetical protein